MLPGIIQCINIFSRPLTAVLSYREVQGLHHRTAREWTHLCKPSLFSWRGYRASKLRLPFKAAGFRANSRPCSRVGSPTLAWASATESEGSLGRTARSDVVQRPAGPSQAAREVAKAAVQGCAWLSQFFKEAYQILWQLHYPSLSGTAWLTIAVILSLGVFMSAIHYVDTGCLWLTTSKSVVIGATKAMAWQRLHQVQAAWHWFITPP